MTILKDTTETVCQRNSSETAQNSVAVKDILCRCAYSQEILIQFFTGSNAPYELRTLTKIKDTTIRQRNSTETAKQNFVKEEFISLLNFGQNYFVQLR